ncbi:MAG: hypothetical protein AAGD18_09005 [Actinomycetota bacterium]
MGRWILVCAVLLGAAGCAAEASSEPLRQKVWSDALEAASADFPELRDEIPASLVYPDLWDACDALDLRGLDGALDAPGRRLLSDKDRAFPDELLRRVDRDFQAVCNRRSQGW